MSKSLSSLWPKNTEGVSHLHTKQCKNRLCIQGPTLCKNYQCFPTTSSFPSFACTAFLKPCLQIDTVLEIRCHKGPPYLYSISESTTSFWDDLMFGTKTCSKHAEGSPKHQLHQKVKTQALKDEADKISTMLPGFCFTCKHETHK